MLGLIFLKYVSDAFEERRAAVLAEWGEAAAEDRDEYAAWNAAGDDRPARRRGDGRRRARQSRARGRAARTGYARPTLDKRRLGQLIDLVGDVRVGDADARSRDVLGRVYEYFLSQFASAEGKKGDEFYTPRCVVRLLVEVLEPYRGGSMTVLTPGRYVGAPPQEDDGEPFEAKMRRLAAEWRAQQAEARSWTRR